MRLPHPTFLFRHSESHSCLEDPWSKIQLPSDFSSSPHMHPRGSGSRQGVAAGLGACRARAALSPPARLCSSSNQLPLSVPPWSSWILVGFINHWATTGTPALNQFQVCCSVALSPFSPHPPSSETLSPLNNSQFNKSKGYELNIQKWSFFL